MTPSRIARGAARASPAPLPAFITPPYLAPLAAYNPALCSALLAAVSASDSASSSDFDSGALTPPNSVPFLAALAALPPTLASFDVLGRLLSDPAPAARVRVRGDVLGPFVVNTIEWFARAEREDRAGRAADDRFAGLKVRTQYSALPARWPCSRLTRAPLRLLYKNYEYLGLTNILSDCGEWDGEWDAGRSPMRRLHADNRPSQREDDGDCVLGTPDPMQRCRASRWHLLAEGASRFERALRAMWCCARVQRESMGAAGQSPRRCSSR